LCRYTKGSERAVSGTVGVKPLGRYKHTASQLRAALGLVPTGHGLVIPRGPQRQSGMDGVAGAQCSDVPDV